MTEYSVIIPAFNAERFIADAIRSVRRQSVAPREIIVVDDGSTDGTATVVLGIGTGIRLIRQANAGCGNATTAGIQAATTEFIAGLDADDLWLDQKMERQLIFLRRRRDVAACFGQVRQFHDGLGVDANDHVADGWTRTTMVVRTEAALSVGAMMDSECRVGETVDWLARARELGNRLELLPEVLALRRIHPGSLTYARTATRDLGYLTAARQAILRRRAVAAKA